MLSTNSTTNDSSAQILSWWGYFSDTNKLKELEEICNSNIVVTEYHNTSELLALVKQYTYDIYIYPWGYHPEISLVLPKSEVDLSDLTSNYHPAFKDRLSFSNLPKNTLFFLDAVAMFLFDKHIFRDFEKYTFKEIITLAKEKCIYLPKETKQNKWLIESLNRHGNAKFNLEELTKENKIYFSDLTDEIIDNNLAICHFDSGEILNIDHNLINKYPNLTFGIHPELSYTSSDVISLRSEKDSAITLARHIGNIEFLNWLSESSLYLNPYGTLSHSTPDEIQNAAHWLYSNPHEKIWIDPKIDTP